MITSLTLKAKDGQNRLTRPEDGIAHKTLLLLMVRLVHTDPMLLLNVRSSTDQLNNEVVRIAKCILLTQFNPYFDELQQLNQFHFRTT